MGGNLAVAAHRVLFSFEASVELDDVLQALATLLSAKQEP